MYINKKGKNQTNEDASRVENPSTYSEPNNAGNSIKIGGNQPLGRSPTNGTRKLQDFDKSTLDNGPEIMYIDCDQKDRRNPMMDYSDGRQTANAFGNGRLGRDSSNTDFGSNYRNSVLTNVRNEVGTNKDGNKIANKSIPLKFYPEREKSPKVINLDDSTYSANTRTLNQKRVNNNPNKGYANPGSHTPNQNTHNSTANDNNNNLNFNNKNNLNSNQSSNLNTSKSDANQIYISDTNKQRRNINPSSIGNSGSNGIIKKMSPNRNNDMSVDLNAQRDLNKLSALKKLSIFSEKINLERSATKPEFSVDTRDHLNSKYTNDLDKIIKYNIKQENFKKHNTNAIVANNPKEGRLHTTQTQTLSAVPKELGDHKQAMKYMTKLSTIMLKDKIPNSNSNNNLGTSTNRNAAVRNTSNDFQEKTLKRNLANSSSPSGKFIRVTMALLSSKGPNCEDKIITRQMRFEKGGVVDLAQPGLKSNRSAPKKTIEVKKTNLRSPRPIRANTQRFTPKEENAAKVVQSWWRDILAKYKDVVDKTVTIQKTWRRYFVRKNLYYKLSAFYFYAYIFDKIENLINRHNMLLGYEQLYNQNAEKYNAIKYLRNVIFIQRAFRFYRNLKIQNQSPKVSSSNAKTTLRKAVKVPKGKAYDNQTNQNQNNLKDQNQSDENKKGPRANDRYDDDQDDKTVETGKSQPKNLLRNGRGQQTDGDKNDDSNPKDRNDKGGNNLVINNNNNKLADNNNKENNIENKDKDADQDENYELVSSAKEKALSEQLEKLRNKFLTNAVQNAIKKGNKRNLTPFVLKWVKKRSYGCK